MNNTFKNEHTQMTRQINFRPQRLRILLVGEGRETEYNYFDKFRRSDDINRKYHITVKRGGGRSAENIVQVALDAIKDAMFRGYRYDRVFCVLDTESPRMCKTIKTARQTANINSISLIFSNPSFEVWLLAHFCKTHKFFIDSAAVEAVLDKHWKKRFTIKYDKADDSIYHRLLSQKHQAMQNAQEVREKLHGKQKDIINCNSATEVYQLLKLLS